MNYILVADFKPVYTPFDYTYPPAKEYIPPVPVYREIVFLQGSEADESIEILNDKGKEAAIQHLADYDNGEGGIWEALPCGIFNHIYQSGKYTMCVNFGVPYISLYSMKIE